MDREGIRKAGNAGLVTSTTTANGDLLHDMPDGRTCIIRKILAYNNTGANLPLLIGTRDRAVAPALVQLLPTLVAINGFDNPWPETEIPAIEFASDTSLLAAGRLGDIYVVVGSVAAPVAGVLIALEIEEYGA